MANYLFKLSVYDFISNPEPTSLDRKRQLSQKLGILLGKKSNSARYRMKIFTEFRNFAGPNFISSELSRSEIL